MISRNRLLLIPLKSIIRWSSSSPSTPPLSFTAARLTNRTVIEIHGSEGPDFLQGLIANDIHHLDDISGHGNHLYSFVLTPNGRVLADVMIYRRSPNHQDDIVLECDSRIANQVVKHLMMHKLRKKLSIVINEKSSVYALFPTSLPSNIALTDSSSLKVKVSEIQGRDIILSNDTRLPISMFRVIVESPTSNNSGNKSSNDDVVNRVMSDSVKKLKDGDDVTTSSNVSFVSESSYRSFRYRLGLSEGFDDNPPGCLPLESNGDITHGISFFKGCYVGQELTARTYHTGVVRKRLMPLHLLKTFDLKEGDIQDSSSTTTLSTFEFKSKDGKTRLGKLCSISDSFGLGLLYIDNVVKNNFELYSNDGDKVATTEIPFWWPSKLRTTDNR